MVTINGNDYTDVNLDTITIHHIDDMIPFNLLIQKQVDDNTSRFSLTIDGVVYDKCFIVSANYVYNTVTINLQGS